MIPREAEIHLSDVSWGKAGYVMGLQVCRRFLLDGGPSCSSSHLDERGGNLAPQQPEGVCMGRFPGLGMGRGRKK